MFARTLGRASRVVAALPRTDMLPLPAATTTAAALPRRAMSSNGFSYPAPRRLEELVNMEKLSAEPADVIASIWVDHHASQPTCMASTVPADVYRRVAERATNTPFFTLPVRREGGHFVLLSQFQDRAFLLTYLEDYRKDPNSALPYLTVTAYTELAHTKGLVLLRADVCAPATVGKADADRVLAQLVGMYSDDALYRHVFAFNKDTAAFDMAEAMRAVEAIEPAQ